MEDDRPAAILGEVFFDLPDDTPPLLDIGLDRLLVDQLVDLGVAITGVVALGAAGIILVEHLVGVIEPGLGHGEGERVILSHDGRVPLRRVDRVQRAVDIDILQLIDQDDGGIAVRGNVARRHGDRQALIGPVAELFHNVLRLCAVLCDIGVVARQAAQHLRRHAPDAVGRRLHRRADLALAFADDVDKGLAVERQHDRAPHVGIVERRHGAIHDGGAAGIPAVDLAFDVRRLALDFLR